MAAAGDTPDRDSRKFSIWTVSNSTSTSRPPEDDMDVLFHEAHITCYLCFYMHMRPALASLLTRMIIPQRALVSCPVDRQRILDVFDSIPETL